MCKNNGQALTGLGITLAVLGSISVILGVAAAAAFSWDGISRICAPLWAGGFVILTGAMGIMAGRNFGRQDGRANGYIPAFMALSIVGIFVTIAQQSVNGAGGSYLGWCFVDSVRDAVNKHHGDQSAASWCQAAASMHWACIAFGFIEMVLCFASSIVGCVVGGCNCCAPQPPPQGVIIMQAPPNPNMAATAGVPGAYAYPQAGYVQQPGGAPPAYVPAPAQQSPPYPNEQKTQVV